MSRLADDEESQTSFLNIYLKILSGPLDMSLKFRSNLKTIWEALEYLKLLDKMSSLLLIVKLCQP